MKRFLNLNSNRSTDRGFTLIEILVVIGIIAILAAIVLIAINPAKQFRDANDTQRSSNVNAILNAIGQYMVDNNGDFPSDLDSPTASSTIAHDASTFDGETLCNDLVPTYMPALPIDPSLEEGEGQVTEDECDDYDTGYALIVDDSGRVTISAPFTQSSTTTISVTR